MKGLMMVGTNASVHNHWLIPAPGNGRDGGKLGQSLEPSAESQKKQDERVGETQTSAAPYSQWFGAVGGGCQSWALWVLPIPATERIILNNV